MLGGAEQSGRNPEFFPTEMPSLGEILRHRWINWKLDPCLWRTTQQIQRAELHSHSCHTMALIFLFIFFQILPTRFILSLWRQSTSLGCALEELFNLHLHFCANILYLDCLYAFQGPFIWSYSNFCKYEIKGWQQELLPHHKYRIIQIILAIHTVSFHRM